MSKTMPLKPRLSEKTFAQSESLNVYVFDVPSEATKLTIAAAVKAQYDVQPTKVRIAAVGAKPKRTYKKSTRSSSTGTRSGFRKAYVTLKQGDKLPIFAAVEEANKPVEAK
jgi:large subunit ribosomal protein L23